MNLEYMYAKYIPELCMDVYRYALSLDRKTGGFYKAQKELLKDSEVTTIFDVGAYKGISSYMYSQMFKDAIIYAFEPDYYSLCKLADNIRYDMAIIPIRYAISDREGGEDFYVNNKKDTNSLLKPIHSAISNVQIAKISVRTIDGYCNSNEIESIDILKLDIQGNELNALKGAKRMLPTIKLIATELMFIKMYENQAMYHDIISYLESHGFKLFNMYNFKLLKSGQVGWCDAIFIRQ